MRETARHEGRVEVIRYLRPNGRRRPIFVEVGAEYVAKAKKMVLSTHTPLYGGEPSIIYAEWLDESKKKGIHYAARESINNEAGIKSPDSLAKTLKRIIDRKFAERLARVRL